jgi:hypothetical protein
MRERRHATWGELLRDAVEKPGRMLEAYTAFHSGWLERKRQLSSSLAQSEHASMPGIG